MVVAVSVIYGLCWTSDLFIFALIHFNPKLNLGNGSRTVCGEAQEEQPWIYSEQYFVLVTQLDQLLIV